MLSRKCSTLVIQPLIKFFHQLTQVRLTKSCKGAGGLPLVRCRCFHEREFWPVEGTGAVKFHGVLIADEPRQRIRQHVDVGNGAGRCPPGDVMEPHGALVSGEGQEVAEPWFTTSVWR